jgi:hypothetical protein
MEEGVVYALSFWERFVPHGEGLLEHGVDIALPLTLLLL